LLGATAIHSWKGYFCLAQELKLGRTLFLPALAIRASLRDIIARRGNQGSDKLRRPPPRQWMLWHGIDCSGWTMRKEQIV
jgi:hypothetical protein